MHNQFKEFDDNLTALLNMACIANMPPAYVIGILLLKVDQLREYQLAHSVMKRDKENAQTV